MEKIKKNYGLKHWIRAKKVIPSGNSLLSKNPNLYHPDKWPTYYKRAKGCEIVSLDNIKYRVPNFLITEELPININNQIIRQALTFTRSLMINKFFIPNNLVFPKSRILMESYFN